MKPPPNKDTRLINTVQKVLMNCRFEKVIIDRKVHINFSGSVMANGQLVAEKEIDVVAVFSHGGKRILLLFECEDSKGGSGSKIYFKGYDADIKTLLAQKGMIKVLRSIDNRIKGSHFNSVDLIRACFVYGSKISESAFISRREEAKKYSFLVWNHFALLYYRKISSILGTWTKYELLKDFVLDLEATTTITIEALEVKQKGHLMYLARMHPGLLLRIGYVVRRASPKTYAYQRLLSKDRIQAIANFISSGESDSFLPNAVIAVFDQDSKTQERIQYEPTKHRLGIPLIYCSAWIIDGQHRVFGFMGTKYEKWSHDKFEPFDLPVILFPKLPEDIQTKTFININYFQKRIKSGLVCDLTTLTKDMHHKLTWPSLLARELNEQIKSPLKDKISISELHGKRPINIASFVQFGLLGTLLGYKSKSQYSGPLFKYALFDPSSRFDSNKNQVAFHHQTELLIRFFNAVKANTQKSDEKTDPWRNSRDYALLRPTGINALFMVLARILKKYPDAKMDFDSYLKPLGAVRFGSGYVSKKGGGWKGFRAFANTIIRKLNEGKSVKEKLLLYGKKEKD